MGKRAAPAQRGKAKAESELERVPLRAIHKGVCSHRATNLISDGRPIVSKRLWSDLPAWIALHAERGSLRKCWNGCRLFRDRHDARRFGACEIRGCDHAFKRGDPVLACRACGWAVCASCCLRPRMPKLEADPLFHGPRSPCLLVPSIHNARLGPGTVIICPGGNYEFLSPLEGYPVVEWLRAHGIASVVLRYRLLPEFGLQEALDDLDDAVRLVRAMRDGPVAAIGFSAAGHLIASNAIRSARRDGRPLLDAQVLIYPSIDPRDWTNDSDVGAHHGFFNRGSWSAPNKVPSLFAERHALLGGDGFSAPPTFLVASTADTCTLPKEHCDPYAAALKRRQLPHAYLRRNFGEHGFGMSGGWTARCVRWLSKLGYGRIVVPPRAPRPRRAPRIVKAAAASQHLMRLRHSTATPRRDAISPRRDTSLALEGSEPWTAPAGGELMRVDLVANGNVRPIDRRAAKRTTCAESLGPQESLGPPCSDAELEG